MNIKKLSALPFVPILLLASIGIANAQVMTTPYNCGSYWSSQPCYSNNYYYGYHQYTYPSYGYYNSYYRPYNYNYYEYSYPTPTCTLTSTYAGGYYGYYGYYSQPITLSWSSNNATSGYISPNVGSVSTYGSTTVYPNGGTTYTMTVYGPGGTNTCSTTYYQQNSYYQQQYYYPYEYSYSYYYY